MSSNLHAKDVKFLIVLWLTGQLTSHLGLSVHTDLGVDHFYSLIYEMRKEKQQRLRHQLGHVVHVKSEQDVFRDVNKRRLLAPGIQFWSSECGEDIQAQQIGLDGKRRLEHHVGVSSTRWTGVCFYLYLVLRHSGMV